MSFIFFIGCDSQSSQKTIAVFVPGIIDDSPIYSMLVRGIKSAVDEKNFENQEKINCFIMEAGTNQSLWEQKITALCSERKYDVIISSNPSLPVLVQNISQKFPNQKFILLDATYEGNQNVYTVSYNQKEQAYLNGYIAGLSSKSNKIGLIAAQEYPIMNEIIYPYFEKGAKEANSKINVEFRIIGNWYDAIKGAEISESLIKSGVDVILPICGGAAQGVISTAKNYGTKITWFDQNGFKNAPEVIISSSVIEQEKMAYELTLCYLQDKIEWGKTKMVGIKDGFIDFIQDDPIYIQNNSEEIRTKMKEVVENLNL